MQMLSDRARGKRCMLFVDDCLDVLPQDKTTEEGYIRHLLVRLLHSILTKGRHVGEGISCSVALHKSRQGKSTEMLWQEAPNLIVFPRTKHTLWSFLLQKFQVGKKELTKIFSRMGSTSRILAFHFEAPVYACWDTGVLLL